MRTGVGAASCQAAARSRARSTYWCGVTPVTCLNVRRKWNGLTPDSAASDASVCGASGIASMARTAALTRASAWGGVRGPRPTSPADWTASSRSRIPSSSQAASLCSTAVPTPAAATRGARARMAGRRGVRKSSRPRTPASAAMRSKYSGENQNATQRSPSPCACPHSKHWPGLPSIMAPGVITPPPVVVRYWKLPLSTTAIECCACRSSNGRSRGPAVQITSRDAPAGTARQDPRRRRAGLARPPAPLERGLHVERNFCQDRPSPTSYNSHARRAS